MLCPVPDNLRHRATAQPRAGDVEPPPEVEWGRITEVGEGWSVDELLRFARARLGLGRIVALYHHSSTPYQIR